MTTNADLIQSAPAVLMGKPVVAGTRITVELILEKLSAGETVEQVLEAHPRLTAEGIYAALRFAADVLRADVVYPTAGQGTDGRGCARTPESRPMNLFRPTLYGVAILLAAFALFGASTSQAMTEDVHPAGWYVAVGVGANRAATMQQAGDNRDTTCYPTRDCRHLPGGMPSGYRWSYDLHPDTGAAFELAVGRTFRSVRLELAVSRQMIGLEQAFTGSTYLDGSATAPLPDSGYTATSTASVDDLTIHTLSVNAYYDVPLPRSRITPYLGVGLGLSFAELSGLHFQIRYACTDDTRCDRPGRYDGSQDVDLSDTVAVAHVHAGADYHLSDRLLLSLKLSYSLTDDVGSRDAYAYHAIPGLTSFTGISGINYGSFLLHLKYLLGNGPDRMR